MRKRVTLLARYLLLGALVNIVVACACVVSQGGVKAFEWVPYHNPRPGGPIAFFVNRRFGREWVVGCGRSGTLIDRYGTQVRIYSGEPWWPPEAVTSDDKPCGAAAGWPLLSFSAWRTVTTTELPDKAGLHLRRVHHWGVVLWDPARGGWEELPAILPLRPIWPGVAVNMVVYAAAVGWMMEGRPAVRRRKRLLRGLCGRCAYPVVAGGRCSECGAVATDG